MRNITREDVEGRSLTADEKGWLEQRSRHAEVELNEKLFGREVIAGSGELEVSGGAEDQKPDETGDADNYDSWMIKELKEEGENRVPAVDFTGCTKKADFVLAMRAWDLEHPEEDETPKE